MLCVVFFQMFDFGQVHNTDIDPDGLYIHLPWCERKCPYCDFFSVAGEGQDIEGSLEALISEVERRGPRSP